MPIQPPLNYQGLYRKTMVEILTSYKPHMQESKAKTYDDGKPPLANLPPAAINAIAQVQAYGHRKYKDFNNYRKGMEASRQASCAMRHIMAYMDGEDLDKESGESHLAHAACRLMFMLQNLNDKVLIDDRYKKPIISLHVPPV